MRERIRCRDWSGGERIFVTDWDKLMVIFLKIGIIVGLAEMFLGLFLKSNFVMFLGIIVTVFSLGVGFWYGKSGGLDFL